MYVQSGHVLLHKESALPPTTDMERTSRHVANGPQAIIGPLSAYPEMRLSYLGTALAGTRRSPAFQWQSTCCWQASIRTSIDSLALQAQTALALGAVMNLPRRQFLHLAVGAAALPAVSRIARAQAYPTRPITMIVPFAAGGPNDTIARIISDRMRSFLGQPVIVENVGGASGTIGVGRVVRSSFTPWWNDVPRGTMDEVSSYVGLDLLFV